jgi:uncharacterized protein YukE
VLGQMTQQLNIVDRVKDEMVSLVTQGFDDVWRGENADAFKQKVQSSSAPKCQHISEMARGMQNGILQAADVIQRADQRANQLVSDLASQYAQI